MKQWVWVGCLAGLCVSSVAAGRELAVGAAAAVYDGAQRGVENQSSALPLIYYEGERLSYLFTTVSYRLIKDTPVELSVVGSGRFDGYDGSDSRYLTGMKRRRVAFDIGMAATWQNLQLSAVTDASGAHRGTEVSLTYDYGIELGKLMIRVVPGISWQDGNLADYYYGVRTEEQAAIRIDGALWQRTAYRVGDVVTPKLSAMALYRITKRWSVLAGAEGVFLPEEISNSPIVDRRYQWGAFAGVAYHFF